MDLRRPKVGPGSGGCDIEVAPNRLDRLLDAEWLLSVLDLADGDAIEQVDHVGGSQTLAHKVRISITVRRVDGSRYHRSYCVKAHLDDGPQTLLTEANFYRHLRPQIDVRSPTAHYTGIDDVTGRSLIIMDDVSAEGGRFLSVNEVYSVEHCRQGLCQLARLHAATWADDRWDVEWLAPRITTLGGFFSDEVLQRLLDDGRGANLEPGQLDAGRIRAALARTATLPPTCVIHGDTHSGNVYLDASDRACWLDWQIAQRGHWSIDVSYHLSTALTVEDRRAHEGALLRSYLDELRQLGIPTPAWDEAWRDYTLGFTWGYFLWAITQISSRAVVLVHLPRIGAALSDHDTFRRLGVP